MSVYDDLDDKWDFFNILQNSLQLFTPQKRVYSRQSRRPTPWITDAILEQIKLKNKLSVLLRSLVVLMNSHCLKNVKTS